MKKNIALNTFGNLIYNLCQWILTILVVRLSTNYENAGYLGLAMTTGSTYSAIALWGMRNYQISDVKNVFSDSEYISSRIITCILAYVCCALGCIFGNSSYQIFCIDAFMICRISEAFVDVLHGMDQKFDRYEYIFYSMTFRGIFSVIIFSVLFVFSKDLVLAILAMSVFDMGWVLLYDLRKTSALSKIRIRISKNIFNLLKECAPIVVFTFLLNMINLFPKNTLQSLKGTNLLGVYTSMASPTLVVQLFASVALSPLIPKLSQYFYDRKKKEFRALMNKMYISLLAIAVITLIGAAVIGRWGLGFLYGKGILKYYYAFMPMILCTIGLAYIWILYAVVTALRKIKAMLIGMLMDFLVVLLISNPLIRRWSLNGANLVQIIGYGLYIPFLIILIERAYKKEI
jgi:O-antigen/teichoic acid export membrane protein